MAFYYFSLFSIVVLGIAYGILALVFWGIVRITRGASRRTVVLSIVGVLFLLLPIGEELWIAWNFGQACKEAGTFIHKKMQVEGFYDDTTHWWRQLQDSQYKPDTQYQFVESRDPSTNTLWRVERSGGELKHFKIDRPSARYHSRNADPMGGTPWAHKVGRSGAVVIDAQTNEEIARYTSFGRSPPWYYISLGVAPFACDAPGRWPLARGNPLVYREVLFPAAK